MPFLDSLFVRSVVAALLAFKAIDDFFATALTIAYRMGALDVAESLGRGTPGDDYRRLVPLMDAVPAWIHGLWVMAGILYLVAITGVFRRARGAFVLLLVAVGLEAVAQLAVRPIAVATGVVVNPRGLADVVRFVLPLALALVLWQDGRRTMPSVSPSTEGKGSSGSRRR